MSFFIDFSTKNFAEASKINGNNEFCFVIGEKELHCHKFVAAFISPKIAHLLISDPTIDSFYINTSLMNFKNNSSLKSQNDDFIYLVIQKMIKGERIEIKETELQEIIEELNNYSTPSELNIKNTKLYSYLVLIESLGNSELKQQFYSNLFLYINKGKTSDKSQNQASSTMTIKEIEDKIKKLNSIEQILNIINSINKENQDNKENITNFIKDYLNQDYSSFVNEIARHFSEIDESLLFKMNPFIFEDILLSDELTIKDEDSFLNTLLNRRSYLIQNNPTEVPDERNEEDGFFLHYVHFECLSEEGIKLFLDEIEIDEINQKIWESLKKRLLLPAQNESKRRKSYKVDEFFYKDRKDFNGIFKHLTEISNGNIQLNKTIEITCSTLCCGNLEKLVDFNCNNGYAHIEHDDGQRWIQFDFKERKIQVNSYLIMSSCRGSEDRPKSWRMEISNDGNNWEKIDEQENVSELNGVNLTKLFNIKMTKQFRFVRIFTDKECFDGCKTHFSIGKIEFYGTISS